MVSDDYPKPGDMVRLKNGCTGYPPMIVPGHHYEVGGMFYKAGSGSLGVIRNSHTNHNDAWHWRDMELIGGPW